MAEPVRWRIVVPVVAGIALLVLFPAPPPVLVQGAILGALSGITALGICLVYRASRIVNFAAGDLGGVAAVLAVCLVASWGWPPLLAIVTGIASGAVLGVVVEFVVIRRFVHSSRLVLTVATIGLASLLGALQLALPSAFGFRTAPQRLPLPVDFSFEWFPVVFRAGHALAIGLAVASVLALEWFLQRTRAGKAVRACSESEERAAMLGIPIARIRSLVWLVAALLAAVATVGRAPIVGVAVGEVLGPNLLLRALAAAVIARMTNLRVAMVAATLLGAAEAGIFWNTNRASAATVLLFVVIVAALVLQPRLTGRRETQDASTWSMVDEPRPLPEAIRTSTPVRVLRVVGTVAAIAAVVLLPMTWNASRVNLVSVGVIFAIVAVSIVLLTGWAGQVSLGQMGFVAVGASVTANLLEDGRPLLVAVIASGLVGAVAAVVVGLPGLFRGGALLPVTSLGFALVVGSYLLVNDNVPWSTVEGRIDRPVFAGRIDLESEYSFYLLCIVTLLLAVVSARLVRRARPGRTLVAARDNERAAQAFGVGTTGVRVSAFALSGFIASVAGALYALHQHALPSRPLDVGSSIEIFSMVVIGGIGSLTGALAGAVFLTVLEFSSFASSSTARLLSSGVGLLLVLAVFPRGLAGALFRLRDVAVGAVSGQRRVKDFV